MTFNEWFREQQDHGFYHDYYGAEAGFDAGLQIERERIKAIIKDVKAQGTWSPWFDCADAILEKIDAEGDDSYIPVENQNAEPR